MLFNQQQCFIYSTASFLSKLRAKKVEKLHNSSFYRNYRKLNTATTISGFVDNNNKKKINPDRPTDPRFFWHATVNTHIFFLALMGINYLLFICFWWGVFDAFGVSLGRDLIVVIFTSTYVVNSNASQAIQHYVIKFVSDLWQVGGFLPILKPLKLVAMI